MHRVHGDMDHGQRSNNMRTRKGINKTSMAARVDLGGTRQQAWTRWTNKQLRTNKQDRQTKSGHKQFKHNPAINNTNKAIQKMHKNKQHNTTTAKNKTGTSTLDVRKQKPTPPTINPRKHPHQAAAMSLHLRRNHAPPEKLQFIAKARIFQEMTPEIAPLRNKSPAPHSIRLNGRR